MDDTRSENKAAQIQRVGSSELRVELRESSDSATFAVVGIKAIELQEKLPTDELQSWMTVRVQRPDLEANPTPLLGICSVSNNELRFTSRFPLSPSVQYRVELSPKLASGPIDDKPILFSSSPEKRVAASSVTAVYPSSEVLPENLLKFYIHFSAPMSRGEAYKRVHLITGSEEVESPFLELGEELWDTEQKRFTLFIHPGRIKRGLKPREVKGAPMTDGHTYRLQIDSDWLGADSQSLAAPFVKTFRVTSPDTQQPDPKNWKVAEPKSGTREPITITFDEPLDHALAMRLIQVLDASKSSVLGQASLNLKETVWTFVPNEAWKVGAYQIRLGATIEDLAGNNLIRKFETQEQANGEIASSTAELLLDVAIR